MVIESTVGYMRPALAYLQDLNLQPEVVIDIGANMGHFSLLSREMFGDVKIHAFEPNIACKELLRPFKHYPVALGASPARLDYFRDPNDPTSGGNSLYKEDTEFFAQAESDVINVKTLDSFYLDADLIKIDVQGAELDVIKGGKQTIKDAKALLIELSFLEYNRHGCLIDDVLRYTRELGFRLIYTFGPQHGIHWHKSRPCQVDGLFVREDIDVFRVV